LSELPRHLFRLDESADDVARLIVPGYCVRDAWGQPDVMRGEETQLLGAWALGHHSGWFVLPGTHSKWVQLQAGRIVQLRTYMTGELFDLLGKHGTIAAAASGATQVWDDATLLQGVQAAQYGALGHQLFGCRARIACGDMPASHASAYLSGLLIGAELQDILQSSEAVQTSAVHVIGTPALARHYQTAGQGMQLEFKVLDAQEVYLAALAYLQSQWNKS
jgi:2-dehydro-3-deoxygalactonokinase